MRARLFALAFVGWAGFAHAVALGEIDVTSHLNQTLVATIPVATSKPGDLEGATVELASNDEFDRAGMERTEWLSALRFEIKDGYIKVTSKAIAREPFVSFLLDVRWIGGRILREYTILLDPPSMGSAPPRPKAAMVPATPQPAPESSEAPAAGTEPAQSQMAPAESAPSPMPAPIASSRGGTYGPTSPQETLWSIAYKLRPDLSLTMDQVQVAIYNANPAAFDHGRLTGLMKGVTLRVPTADEIRAVDAASAKSQVAAARNGGSMPTPAPRASRPAPKPEPKRAEAPPAEPAYTPPPTQIAEAPKPELKPEPKPEPKVEKSEPAPEPAPKVEVAPPPTSTLSQATPEPTPSPSTPEPAAEPTPAPEAAKPAEKPAAPAPKAQTGSILADVIDRGKGLVDQPWFIPAAAGFVLVIAGLLGFRKIGEIYAKWAYDRASRKSAAPAAASGDGDATLVAPTTTPTGQMADEAVTQMAPTPQIAATQVMAAQTMQQTMQSPGAQALQQTFQQTQIQEPAAASTGGHKVDFDVTGNFANETVQINLDAGDPVSEAEFHRAYGLYDEAALLLKQALQKDPKRIDARVKLAEIYFEASKSNEFVEVARELKAQLPEAEWQKIALLGSQIAPGNDLFAGGAVNTTGTVDLSFDDPIAPEVAAPAAAPAGDGLDFKLEDVQLDMPAATPAPVAVAAAPAEGGLEFDLGSLSMDTPAAAVASAPAAAADTGGDLNLADFDLGGETPAAPAGGGESVELSGDIGGDGGGDESSTKLDLARAYIDMGDNDMAKSLLNEVVAQGNAQQKTEAQELLKRVPA